MTVGSVGERVRRSVLAGLLVSLVAAVGVVLPTSGSEAGAQESSFPAPVVAPVDPASADLRVAVVAFYGGEESSAEQPAVVVQLAGDATALPSGSRVSVLSGDPAGEQARTSMVLIDGEPTGVLETSSDGLVWEGQADAQVDFTADGAVLLELPESQVSGPAWIEVETPDGASFTTGAYPLPVVLGFGEPGALSTATLTSEQAPDGSNTVATVTLDSVPELQLGSQGITVSSASAPPTELDGVGVTQVVDSVRIAPDYTSSTRVPFFATIDQASGDVQLWETHDGLPGPAGIPASTFVTTPLSPDGEGSTITIDRARLLEAVGLAPDDEDVAIGITRTVILDDGRQLIAEGPVGTVAWFGGSTTPVETPEGVATTVAVRIAESSSADEDGGPSVPVLAGAVLLLTLLIGVAVWSARRSRRARVDAKTLDAMGKVVKTGPEDSRSAPDPGVGGIGVAGARAAVMRRAREQSGGAPPADTEPTGADDAEETVTAAYAAMRRRASKAERPSAAAAGATNKAQSTDAAQRNAAEGKGTAGDDTATPLTTGGEGEKATHPDDALDALNRLIDDLD